MNAWSGLLLQNGEKISDLCSQLESVKVEQDELDQELDRVNAQQAELEGKLWKLCDATLKGLFSNSSATRRGRSKEQTSVPASPR